MCGLIGHVPVGVGGAPLDAVARESSVRGLHAFGVATWQDGPRVRRFFELQAFGRACLEACSERFLAHARYSTSGDWRVPENNQPIVAAGMALAFNGCIHMGQKHEFESAFGVLCDADNDGEVFLRRLEQGQEPGDFLRGIAGSFAGVWWRDGRLFAARNARRPLHVVTTGNAVLALSTLDIARRSLGRDFEARSLEPFEVIELSSAA